MRLYLRKKTSTLVRSAFSFCLISGMLKIKSSHSCDFSRDAASLRSLAPRPQGLTNDDEVGVQSTDGVPDSRVHVKLPSDRRESNFNRSFPSVDELDGSVFKYIKISFMLALVTSRQRRVITTFYFSTFRCREIFYLYYFFSQKTVSFLIFSAY